MPSTCLRYLTPLRRWSWPRMRMGEQSSAIHQAVVEWFWWLRRKHKKPIKASGNHHALRVLLSSRVPRTAIKRQMVATRYPTIFLPSSMERGYSHPSAWGNGCETNHRRGGFQPQDAVLLWVHAACPSHSTLFKPNQT